MLVFVPLYILVFVATYFAEIFKSRYRSDKNKKNLIYFILLVALVFIALDFVLVTRYGIGLDYFFSDNAALNNMKDGVESVFSEPMIKFVAKFVVKFNLPNYVYFMILGTITTFAYVLAIFLNKDDKYLTSMFVFLCCCLYVSCFNQVRQSVGIALGMLALSLVINYFGKIYVYIIAFIIAGFSCLFHYAEIINVVILLIYILVRSCLYKLKMNTYLIVCFILIAISPIILIILKYTISFIPILNRYAGYILSEDNSAELIWRVLGSIFMYIVQMFLFVIFLLNFTKREEYQMKLILIYLSACICFMFISTLTKNLMTADRLRTMIYGTELFIIPYLFNEFKGKGKKEIVFKAGTMTLMFCIMLGTFNVAKVYPYRSLLIKDIYIY